MMQLFLTEVLDWVDPKDFSLDSILTTVQEVDLDYPDEMSSYQLQIIEDNNFSLGKKNNLSLTEEIKENTNSIIKT